MVLTQILCARRFEITPTFAPHAPDLTAMLANSDATLVIGDPALFVDHVALGLQKTDLGAEWTSNLAGKLTEWVTPGPSKWIVIEELPISTAPWRVPPRCSSAIVN